MSNNYYTDDNFGGHYGSIKQRPFQFTPNSDIGSTVCGCCTVFMCGFIMIGMIMVIDIAGLSIGNAY